MSLVFSNPKLPGAWFVHIPGNKPSKSIGQVRLGISGYYPVEDRRCGTVASHAKAEALVRELNAELGVIPLGVECLMIGSMFGWESPGADPGTYTPEMIACLTS